MSLIGKQHIKDSVILAAIALTAGVWLISTTVIISGDGVTYIERAQKLSTHAREILNLDEPVGFPALIAAFHRLFTSSDSVRSWILSGQLCVLTCRILAIIILYIFGTLLFGRQHSFWAVLILIFLPYPSHFGVDVVREWPFLLFLFTALLLFYGGVQKSNALYLFAAGLVCAVGTIIRPECAQVLLYGLSFFSYKLFSGLRNKAPLRNNWIYICLAAGFLAVFVPYAAHLEKIAPYKLQDIYRQFHQTTGSISSEPPASGGGIQAAALEAKGLFSAVGNLLNEIAENLLYYFTLPAGIGCYLLFFKSPRRLEDRRLLVGLFIGFYLVILCLLYWRWGYISRRHALPLTVLFCYCVPAGLEQMAQWLAHKKSSDKATLRKWGFLLTAIGIGICLPKLCRPLGDDKKVYRQAAEWIADNTNPGDRFCSFDSRIPFYADRPYYLYKNTIRFKPRKADYLITRSKNGQVETPIRKNLRLQKTFPCPSTDRQLLIYKRIP